eukprot:669335-Ditylum_brightwellii.AAC.1
MREQLGLLTTDDAGGRSYCEAKRNYSIGNTVLSSKTWLVQDLLHGMCPDGNNNQNEEERLDDSLCSSPESCIDEGKEEEEEDIDFKFVDLPEFQANE